MNKTLTNREMVKILLRHALNRDDICALVGCCKTKGSQVIADIQKNLMEEGQTIERGFVSSSAFLAHTKWNLTEIIEKARIEKELEI